MRLSQSHSFLAEFSVEFFCIPQTEISDKNRIFIHNKAFKSHISIH